MFSLFDLFSPALKAVLLVGPLLAVLATVGSTDILHSSILLAVWSLPVATALQLDFEKVPSNVTGATLVDAAIVLKTLQVLLHAKDSADESIWLAPILAAIAFTLLQDFPFSWTQEVKKPAGTIAYNRRTGFLLSLIVAGQGFALAFLDPSLSTYSVLLMIEAAIGVLLMSNVLSHQEHETRNVWRGGSTLVLSWIFLQVCSLPMAADTTVLAVQLSCIVGLIFVSILMVEDKEARRPLQLPLVVTAINTLTTLVATFIDLLRLVLGSAVTYQAVVIACLAVIVATIDKPWYSAHADFPVKTQARSILDIVDRFVKVFYVFSGDPQVQEIMIAVAPAIMQPRSIIHRVLASNWKNLLLASNGVSYTLTPLNEVAVLMGLFLGPVIAAVGILAQVVSSGASFVRSQWFWAASALGSLLFLLLSQLACGAQVTLVSILFSKDAGYTRVYTQEGQYALVAQLVLVGACIALFVVLSMTDSVEVRMVQSQAGLGGKLSLARGVHKLTSFFLRPSLLLMVAAVFVVIFVAIGSGSPIQSLDVKRITNDKPDWLVTTPLDVALDNTFAMALVNAIGPEVRIGLLVTKLIAIGVEQLNCVGCYCVPGGEAVDFFEDVGSSIGFRRRLLEEPYGNETMSPLNGRRLLAYEPDVENGCSRGSSSCSTFEICVADLLKPVAQILEFMSGLLIKGIAFAVEFVIKNILLRIPTINRLVESFLHIKDILEFDGFHPFSFATYTFDVHMLTLGLGNLPSFSLPSVSMPSTLTLVMIGIAAVLLLFMTYTAGLLEPVLTSAVRGAEVSIVIGTISFAITAASMLSSFVSELKLLGFEVKVELASNVWMYACVGGMLVMSLMLWVGEHSASQLVNLSEEVMKQKRKSKDGKILYQSL